MADEEMDVNFRGTFLDVAAEDTRLRNEVFLEREKAIERLHYLARVYTAGRDYTNVIIAVGYAVFGALWAGTAHDVSPPARLLSGGLLAVSLALFVLWEIYKMWSNQREGVLLARAINEATSRDDLADRVRDADGEITVQDLLADRYWPYFFYPSLVCGLLGALVLAGSCLWTGGYLLL